MQIDLILGPSGANEAYVRQAHLRPLRGTNYIPSVEEHITVRPHQNNIKMFYDQTRGSFYDSNPPLDLGSSWYKTVSKYEMNNLKYIKNWDDSLWAGTQRMSYKLYGTTHEILVPVWLEKCRGLKFTISAQVGQHSIERAVNISEEYLYQNIAGQPKLYKTSETFHNEFTKYWINYLDYISVLSGDDRVMNVGLESGVSNVFGLLVESGNLESRQNFNLSRNLTYRERPLLEANSLLTNTFQDYKMICTHLINFNLCLDEETFFGTGLSGASNQSPTTIWVKVEALREKSDFSETWVPKPMDNLYDWYEFTGIQENQYIWEVLENYDIYTNHDYIPRQMVKTDTPEASFYVDGEEYRRNALEYLRDNQCIDIIHSNKITQGICHWALSDDNPTREMLFNVYDGFGAYTAGPNGTWLDYKHGFGTATSIQEETYNPFADNTAWAGIPKIGDGGTIEEIFANPQKYIKEGFFKDTSESIGGIQFKYRPQNPDDPKKIYIGTMTTPWECDPEAIWTINSSLVDSKYVIGILQERFNYHGDMDLPASRTYQGTRDTLWDWHVHSDTDNRFAMRAENKEGTKYLYLYYNRDKIQEYWDSHQGEAITYQDLLENNILTWEEKDLKDDKWIRVGGTGFRDTRAREQANMSALYIAMRRIRQYNYRRELVGDNLYVILYHPRCLVEKIDPSNPQYIPEASDRYLNFHTLYPHGLTIGGFIRSVQDYYNKYYPCWQAIQLLQRAANKPDKLSIDYPSSLPDLVNLEYIQNITHNIQSPPIISFHRSIQSDPDHSLSYSSQEIHYRKKNYSDEYVYRYDGNIKPAMFPPRTKRQEGTNKLLYIPQFGRNFAYCKSLIFTEGVSKNEQLTPSQRLFISSGVPPRYPSLEYNSIVPMIYTGPNNSEHCKNNPHGDILYSEPLPIFYGLNWDGRDLGSLDPYKQYLDPTQPYQYHTLHWYEWKWFNESAFIRLPKYMRFVIQSPENNRDTLETLAWKVISWPSNSWGRKESNLGKFYEKKDDLWVPIRDQYILEDCETRVPPISLGDLGEYILDVPYLSRVYDLEFNLQKTEAQVDPATGQYKTDPFSKEILYLYTYEMIATLK